MCWRVSLSRSHRALVSIAGGACCVFVLLLKCIKGLVSYEPRGVSCVMPTTITPKLINLLWIPICTGRYSYCYPQGYPQSSRYSYELSTELSTEIVDKFVKINFSCESRACCDSGLTFELSTGTKVIHRVIHSLWITRDISRLTRFPIRRFSIYKILNLLLGFSFSANCETTKP